MRALLQRVSSASVEVDGHIVGQVGAGLLIFLGVGREDTKADADYLVDKIANLRVFSDDQGKMNRSVLDTGGALLVVSQFTLYGDCSKGRRPSFDESAPAEIARELYEYFVAAARRTGVAVETGTFQAEMKVSLINEGPVTFWCESKRR